MVGQVGSNIWSSETTALATPNSALSDISTTKARAGQKPANQPAARPDPASAPTELSPDLQAWMTGQQDSGGSSNADLAQQAMAAYARAQ